MCTAIDCLGYEVTPDGRVARHNLDTGEVTWSQDDDLPGPDDMAVVDIACGEDFVAVTTGKYLRVFNAADLAFIWRVENPHYVVDKECFSRLTICENRIYTNISFTGANKGEVRCYTTDPPGEGQPKEAFWDEPTPCQPYLQRMPIVDGVLYVQLRYRAPLLLKAEDGTRLNEPDSCEPDPAEIVGCGGWRCKG